MLLQLIIPLVTWSIVDVSADFLGFFKRRFIEINKTIHRIVE